MRAGHGEGETSEHLRLFQNADVGGRDLNHSVEPSCGGFAENNDDQHYLAARLTHEQSDAYVALYVVRNPSEGGAMHDRVCAQWDVVEVAPLRTGMVDVDADAMAKAIDDTARVALYGI